LTAWKDLHPKCVEWESISTHSLPVEHWLQTDHLSPSSSALCCQLHLPQLYLSCFCHNFFLYTVDLFSVCSLVSSFLNGLVVSTVVFLWQCAHHFILASVQPSSIFFFSAGPTQAPSGFLSRGARTAECGVATLMLSVCPSVRPSVCDVEIPHGYVSVTSKVTVRNGNRVRNGCSRSFKFVDFGENRKCVNPIETRAHCSAWCAACCVYPHLPSNFC